MTCPHGVKFVICWRCVEVEAKVIGAMQPEKAKTVWQNIPGFPSYQMSDSGAIKNKHTNINLIIRSDNMVAMADSKGRMCRMSLELVTQLVVGSNNPIDVLYTVKKRDRDGILEDQIVYKGHDPVIAVNASWIYRSDGWETWIMKEDV